MPRAKHRSQNNQRRWIVMRMCRFLFLSLLPNWLIELCVCANRIDTLTSQRGKLKNFLQFIRRNRCCSASVCVYFPHFVLASSVCLSSVCHIQCLCQNRSAQICSVQPCFPAVTRNVPTLAILHYTVNDITCVVNRVIIIFRLSRERSTEGKNNTPCPKKTKQICFFRTASNFHRF